MEKVRIAQQLDLAAEELSQRGLVLSAKWAAEASAGTDAEFEPLPIARLSPLAVRAKTYFDSHEYDRCWNCLKGAPQEDVKAQFLRLFSRYHAGEKRKEDDQGGEFFAQNKPVALNPYVIDLLTEIESLPESTQGDAFVMYLRGILLRHQKRSDDAAEELMASIHKFPWNWGAWMELEKCLSEESQIEAVVGELEPSAPVMARVFRVFASQELIQHCTPALEADIEKLGEIFPSFYYLKIQRAMLHIHDFEHDEAGKLFEDAIREDPLRLEGIDTYSHLLYVTSQRPKLSFLAQLVAKADRYRPESCCVIANYYSLIGQHAKAIVYYQRALTMNRSYLPAWTLMGHEYVEANNLNAAIDSYRSGLDICPTDYRAWYGLGGAYETLGIYEFAQYNYERALALRSTDPRIWKALANVLELRKRPQEAIDAYTQAIRLSSRDAFSCYRVGLLYMQLGKDEDAAQAMTASREALDRDEDPEEALDAASRATLWLAEMWAERRNWSQALEHAEDIINSQESLQAAADVVEAARVIIRNAISQK